MLLDCLRRPCFTRPRSSAGHRRHLSKVLEGNGNRRDSFSRDQNAAEIIDTETLYHYSKKTLYHYSKKLRFSSMERKRSSSRRLMTSAHVVRKRSAGIVVKP